MAPARRLGRASHREVRLPGGRPQRWRPAPVASSRGSLPGRPRRTRDRQSGPVPGRDHRRQTITPLRRPGKAVGPHSACMAGSAPSGAVLTKAEPIRLSATDMITVTVQAPGLPARPSRTAKGGESRASLFQQPARQRTAPRDAGAGRATAPRAAARYPGQGVAACRAGRTTHAPGYAQGRAAALRTGALTSLSASRTRTRNMQGRNDARPPGTTPGKRPATGSQWRGAFVAPSSRSSSPVIAGMYVRSDSDLGHK